MNNITPLGFDNGMNNFIYKNISPSGLKPSQSQRGEMIIEDEMIKETKPRRGVIIIKK